jgi:tetratricopeptide (TPR) repeat protein
MTGRMVRIALGLMPVVVIIAAIPVTTSSWGGGPLLRRLAEYRDAGYLEQSYNELVWHMAQPFVWHSRLERSMTINSVRVPGGLNFYVVRKDPKGYFDQFACNCAAIPPGDTVVCDAALLDYIRNLLAEPRTGPSHQAWLKVWLEERRKDGRPTDPSEQEAILDDFEQIALIYSQALLRWVLGHEIGHISRGHLNAGLDWAKPSRRLEDEADAFVIDRLSANGSVEDVFYLTLMLESMISTLYLDALRQTHPGAVNDLNAVVSLEKLPPITAADPGHHPALIQRAISMWKLLAKIPNNDYITAAAKAIEGNISTGPAGAELTFCRSSPAPRLAHALVVLPEYAADADYVASLIHNGLMHADMTAYSDAQGFLTTAVEVAKGIAGSEGVRLLSQAHYWRGTIRYILRDHMSARGDLDEAARLDPDEPRILALAGWNSLALGDLASAEASWNKAIKLDARYADAYAGLAVAALARNDTSAGIAAYRMAVENDPGYGSDSWLRYSRFLTTDAVNRIGQVRQASRK